MTKESPSLLILSGVQGDPRRYRSFHLYEQAQLAGLSCQLSHLTDPDLRHKVATADMIILHRAAYDAQVAWVEKHIHERGGLLITDLDDLVFEPEAMQFIHSPDFSDPIRRSLYREDVECVRKTLQLSNQAITSGTYLAERVELVGKPASVHRNAFSLEMLAISEQAHRPKTKDTTRIVIGYPSGTPTHDQDFASIKPALKAILSSHPNAELWLVGRLDPGDDWGEISSRIKKLDLVPWRKLPHILAQFDINLAPLQVDNPFGQSKSEIKYVEAALLRVPTVASPSDSYSYAIRHGETGSLAGSAEEWNQQLETLMDDPQLRLRMGQNAYQDVLQRYHPITRARQLVEMLNQITGGSLQANFKEQDQDSRKQPTGDRFWSCAGNEGSPTLVQRGLYTLKYRSATTLLSQVWIFLRRLVSPIFPFPKPR